MKTIERKTKEEKRRLQLNKTNSNMGAVTLEKVQGLNKRVLAMLMALVFVLTVVPTTVFMVVKGADSKTHLTELEASSGAETVLTNTYNGGKVSYYDSNDNRTYTFDLGNKTLSPGDTVSFDSENKEIVWERDPKTIYESDLYKYKDVIAEGLMTVEEDEDGQYILSLKDGETLSDEETYFYKADDNTCYAFSVDNIAGLDQEKTLSSNNNTRINHVNGSADNRKNKRIGKDITITINPSTNQAVFDGTELERKTIYTEKTTAGIDDNHVYIIVATTASDNGKYILTYNATSSQSPKLYDLNANSGCDYRYYDPWIGSTTDRPHTIYPIVTKNNSIRVTNKVVGTPTTFYSSDFQPVEKVNYIMAGPSGNDAAYIQSEFLAIPGIRLVGQTNGTYSPATMALGKIGSNYSNNSNADYKKVYVYNYCATHPNSTIWTYTGNQLSIQQDYTADSTKLTDLHFSATGDNFTFANLSNNNTINLYELETVYEETPVTAGFVGSLSHDEDTFPALDVSYTDNASIAGNDLEIDKTVTEVDKEEGIFDIKLEAYATAATLNQPATDIELVLDSSRNMSNVLYSRQYTNLNTYEGFTEIDLTTGNVSNDKLFDRDAGDWGGAALEVISRIFAGSRDYIHNKYVEDPAAPGTYVYLHQKYELHNLIQNRYTYYFTSSDGTTYTSNTFTQNIFGTALDPSTIPSTGLRFTATGRDPVVRDKIYTLSNYSGRNTNNGSAATNKELYAVAQATGLYIKDNDGNFRRVYLYKDRRGNGTAQGVAQTGMYRYVIFENDVEYGPIEYEFSTGNTELLNDGQTRAGDYGVFQGFRNYNDNHELEGDYILSKTLYTLQDEDVTALQAMKEALESFLLNAHKQVAEKGAEAYVGLVAYDRDAQIKYKLNSNGSTGDYTDLAKTVGDHSVDRMISDIYNYRVTRQYDRVSRQMAYYNVINDSNHNGSRYNGTYAAEVDDGLTLARDELANHNHDKANPVTGDIIKSRRYAILFTAGVPSAYSSFLGFDTSGDFTTSTASSAISIAHDIKNRLDTTFYTVGLFDNADEDKINGDYWYYATFGQKVKFNARTSPYWGGSWVANGFNIDPKDAYATNRMLAYISSDYSTPRTLGLTRDSFHPGRSGIWGWISSGTGYRVDQSFSRNDTGYYLAVSPNTLIETDSTDDDSDYAHATEDVAAILADVFQKLNIATAAPNNTLTADSLLVDGITNYFDLVVNDPDHMPTAQVMDMSDNVDQAKTSALNIAFDDGGNADSTTKTIAVKGFPYSTYWVGDNQNDQRKVVLTFRVKRTDGLIGGNDIPTNLSKTAIYDGDPASITDSTPWGVMEERFEIPKVDLEIEMSHFAKSDSIYYGGTEDLREVIDLSDLQEIALAGDNGNLIPNEFVTVAYEIKDGSRTVNTYRVPVGSTVGKWDHPVQDDAQTDGTPGAMLEENLERIFVQPEQSTRYTVNVEVTPVYNGTVRKTSFDDNDANVYVFLPHYETYNGTVENAGDTYDLTESGKTPLLVEWKYDEVLELNGVDAEALLDNKELPSIVYDLNKYNNEALTIPEEGKNKNTFTVNDGNVAQGTESIAGNLDEYTVNEKTDLIMRNVTLTAVPREYTVEQKVADNYYDSIGVIYKTIYYDDSLQAIETVYYDADGNVMPDATGPRNPGTYIDDNGNEQAITLLDDAEPVYGSVTKHYSPDPLNASTNDKVTFLNDDDGRTNGAFTINLRAHDVIITNQTTGDPNTDYSDPTKKFPLTFTLKDENGDPVEGEQITYIDANEQTQTATTNSNGNIVISMKDDDTITLKEIRDGYKLAITSTPAPGDLYTFAAQATIGDGTPTELTVPDDTETTPDVTISDEARIDLVHHIGEIPVTGFFDNDESSYGILIAVLAAVFVTGGGYTAYRVYKPRKESN